MSTTHKAVRRTPEEWRATISECRKSGLSDAEWCRRNGIPPSSMYNAVSRLRKLACSIPETTSGSNAAAKEIMSPRQDVVPIGVIPELPVTAAKAAVPAAHLDNLPVIEIQSGSVCIRVCNGTDPGMLSAILHSLGGSLC